jgi:hypothetical protein
MEKHQTIEPADQPEDSPEGKVTKEQSPPVALEYGGPKGPEPTRYGDWEQAGRCTDF